MAMRTTAPPESPVQAQESGTQPYARYLSDNFRRIIVCADDFGLSPAVNEGIFALARKGRIGAVSCRVTATHFWRDARRLKQIDVDVGLHLDLSGAGLLTGNVFSYAQFLFRAHTRRLSMHQYAAQIERQLDLFEAAFGAPPHFVASQHHIHQLPQIREALFAILHRRYGKALPWLRCSQPGDLTGSPLKAKAKAYLAGALGSRTLRQQARRAGFDTNRALLGAYDFQGGVEAYVRHLLNWLSNAEDGDLLVCHPAQPEPGEARAAGQRGAEFIVLNDDMFAHSLRRKGLQIVRRP